jgi:putative ABC transport system ATP-binding protein
MNTDSVAIAAVGLTKRFGRAPAQVTALSRVDFSVKAGEFVAVMGASGSGKSTLLHLLAGLTTPDEGQVLVEGQDITRLPDAELTRFRRRRIGLVFQSFNLIPALNAEQNILLPLLADGHSAAPPAELETLLELLGLADRRNHLPGALSGGEQQRVAIARALIANPAIVLADEPTGNLDYRNSQLICGMLKKLNEAQHRTIVVVTHEPAVARWADRVVVLQDGRVGAEFAPGDFEGLQSMTAHYHQWTAVEAEQGPYARD